MEVITKSDLLRKLPEMWKHQYPVDRAIRNHPSTDAVHKALLEEPNLTEARAKEIIGANWTRNECDECGLDSHSLIFLGDGAAAQRICLPCLKEATSILEAQPA